MFVKNAVHELLQARFTYLAEENQDTVKNFLRSMDCKLNVNLCVTTLCFNYLFKQNLVNESKNKDFC